jgi:hypothetical protein
MSTQVLHRFLKNMIRMHRQSGPDEKLELTSEVLSKFFAIDGPLALATADTKGLGAEDAQVLEQAHKIAQHAVDSQKVVPLNVESSQLMQFEPDLI